jgi:hypothetical protein
LVELFGKPETTPDTKVNVNWTIEFDEGSVASIYDWKTGIEPELNFIWNVGGFDHKVMGLLRDKLKE